jgi:phosphatidyl-myo-inositol dimannoside synthase
MEKYMSKICNSIWNKKMNILLVTQDYYPVRGGIQSYCHHVAVNICKAGHSLTMICPGVSQESDKDLPFKVIRIKSHSSFLFLKLFGFLKKHIESQKSKQNPYDHVLFGQWQNAIPFLFPKQQPQGPKYHSMVHGRELLSGVFGSLTPWLCPKVYHKLDSVVPNSFPIADMFKTTVSNFNNINVIHPGVDPQHFSPKDTQNLKKELGLENKKILVSITRLVARKNIGLVIRAMPSILEKVPDAHFVIGGRGPEFDNLAKLIQETKMQEHISLLGSLEEERLVEYFSLGDIFLLPSSQNSKDVEGFGIVFLEAGACEVAVIGADTGGIRDAVVDRKTGILLKESNEVTLSKAVIELLNDEDRAKEMGKNARQRILNELSWEQCGINYVEKVFK